MILVEYNRLKAVAYARRWAYYRNPAYYDFENIGGDCTNFASQCLYAGSGVMNVPGWFYFGINNRSPSWTGVEFFYDFITTNEGIGPRGEEADISRVRPGDFVQLKFPDRDRFTHTPVIVSVGYPARPSNILLAAHSYDAYGRPLDTYMTEDVRFIHITAVAR